MRISIIRKKFICSFIFICLSLLLYSEERASLRFFTFGPKSDDALVLCFTDNDTNKSNLKDSIENFMENFSKSAMTQGLHYTLIIALSYNDYTTLPDDVEVQSFVGMTELKNEIIKYKNPSVFIFDKGEAFNINYKSKDKKTPAWMLKLLLTSLSNTKLKTTSKIFSLDKNFEQKAQALDIFFEQNIPALQVTILSDSNIQNLILNLVDNYPLYYSKLYENNFFIFFNFGNIKIVSERTIIIFTEILLILLFLTTFFKTVLKGETNQTKKFFLFWAFYFVLAFTNFIFVFLANFFTSLIFKTFLGTSAFVSEYAIYYIAAFVLAWLFQVAFFYSIATQGVKKYKLTSKLFENYYPSIYFANLFVLSILDFSVFIFAFFSFAISNFYYITKKTFRRLIVYCLTFIPSLLYFILVIGNANAIINIIKNKTLFFALISLSVIFIANEIYFISQKYFKRKVFLSFASLILLSIILYSSFYFSSKNYKTPVELRQIFDNDSNHSLIKAKYKTNENLSLINLPSQNKNSRDYIQIKASLENYLDRSLGKIRINSPLNVEAIQVFVLNKNGASVYDADKNFTGTERAKFISSQRPALPFEINFSSEKDAALNIVVKIFSYDNPFNTQIDASTEKNKKIYVQNFLLEAEYEFKLNAK